MDRANVLLNQKRICLILVRKLEIIFNEELSLAKSKIVYELESCLFDLLIEQFTQDLHYFCSKENEVDFKQKLSRATLMGLSIQSRIQLKKIISVFFDYLKDNSFIKMRRHNNRS